MALDEYLYGKFINFFKSNKKVSTEVLLKTVNLNDLKARLTVLARALTGDAIEIFPAEREGGFKNNNFFLPASFGLLSDKEQNTAFYLFRVLYLSIQKKLHFNWNDAMDSGAAQSQQKALETAPQVLEVLFREFPIVQNLHDDLKKHFTEDTQEKKGTDLNWLYGKWMQNEPEKTADYELKNFSNKTEEKKEVAPTTTIQSKAVEEVKTIEIDKKQQEDYVLTHNFEKVETAEEFNGVWRDFDSDDDLESHQEALDELNLKFTVRADDTAHSIYQLILSKILPFQKVRK